MATAFNEAQLYLLLLVNLAGCLTMLGDLFCLFVCFDFFVFFPQTILRNRKGNTHWKNRLIFSLQPTVIIAVHRDYGKLIPRDCSPRQPHQKGAEKSQDPQRL